jgi:hypothetical protein
VEDKANGLPVSMLVKSITRAAFTLASSFDVALKKRCVSFSLNCCFVEQKKNLSSTAVDARIYATELEPLDLEFVLASKRRRGC